jgi:hypothetical protein
MFDRELAGEVPFRSFLHDSGRGMSSAPFEGTLDDFMRKGLAILFFSVLSVWVKDSWR